jgi:hypothetical protein
MTLYRLCSLTVCIVFPVPEKCHANEEQINVMCHSDLDLLYEEFFSVIYF